MGGKMKDGWRPTNLPPEDWEIKQSGDILILETEETA